MKKYLKLLSAALILFALDYFLDPNLGKFFGYTIAGYNPLFDILFLASYIAFLIEATEKSSESLSDAITGGLFVGAIVFIVGAILFLCQLYFGGNFVLPFMYIISFIGSVLALASFFSEYKHYRLVNFFFFPIAASAMLFPLFIFGGIVPLMIVLWVPYLIVTGAYLFFTHVDEIADWLTQ